MRDHTPKARFTQARSLRRNMTVAEDMLWRCLRGRGFEGLKFRRQVPIGPYIADFACLERRLIIELDGRPHEEPEQQAHDRRRDAWFFANGWRVLRLDNERVIGGAALNDIALWMRPPSSDPR
ncbi:endonuclease domain-containing protein [Methylocystis sp. JR02]|uniref:endonuclease domain-containing protein n=1 Tax=Methylocystis sp. JR02 TaxID=3046284 RepID=UPI0024B8B47E|nr:endonuclease domain-containing protein [Methylocystis sp. JR02]MDJ0447700.1 endonuclease domain-containing protein [Methylocystis sp. JR02]